MPVRRATLDDLDAVAPLFDAYREFYGLPGDSGTSAAARAYLGDRMSRGESIVLVASADPGAAAPFDGFTQLYPSFCSLELAPIFVLYDLFVHPDARGRGVATALLDAARQLGLDAGAARLELSTAHTNTSAQRLYESLGWMRDEEYLHYELPLS
ncbi:GNAT family N-acetyltransferase [Herbiconiux ginsengi]|uniref:Ribosomal protein S18 acetylase RimI n=1 Tax=Herbiconiux ginsengi TaxID=381665 RepID=A0A1H3JL34_9MICO|nr:N-acetyltransferase [Herbiconiux ginsengi]SDY40597.1 Ribosomal protein S18 acetylase RimI [Herbiconiux ginsengi]